MYFLLFGLYPVNDVLRPVEVDTLAIDGIGDLPPKSSFDQTFDEERIVAFSYVDFVLGQANCLFRFVQLQIDIDIVGEVDFEEEIKEIFQFFAILTVVFITFEMESHRFAG